MSKKLLVVTGATGNQGGSVIRTFLAPDLRSAWDIRGVTRDASSPASQSLSSLGVDMVTASFDDVFSLTTAFHNATAIFAVTDFWSIFLSPTTRSQASANGISAANHAQSIEETYGLNILLAASQIPSLQRFIWSTLPPVLHLTNNKLKHVCHFDGKANISRTLRQSFPSLWTTKTSEIHIGHYMSNILPGSIFSGAYNNKTQRFELRGPMDPDAPIPYIDTNTSTGPYVKALICDEPVNTVLVAYDEMRSRRETCEILSRVTGKQFAYVQVPAEEIARENEAMGLEAAESGIWTGTYGFFGENVDGWKEGLTWPKDLKERVQHVKLEDWIARQDWRGILDQEQASQ